LLLFFVVIVVVVEGRVGRGRGAGLGWAGPRGGEGGTALG